MGDISDARMLLLWPKKKGYRSARRGGVVNGGGEERKAWCS